MKRKTSVQGSAILLHDDARHNILEGLSKFAELLQAIITYLGSPSSYFVLAVLLIRQR